MTEAQEQKQSRLAALRNALEQGSLRHGHRLINSLHPAEIASLIESLPPARREIVWEFVDPESEGDVLIELESPDLDARQRIIRSEIQILQLQLRRQAGRSETVADVGILDQQLAEALAEYRGLAAQRARLVLHAPHAGVVRDLSRDLCPGLWLPPQMPLARVVDERQVRLRGYLQEESLWRVEVGAEGRFVADGTIDARSATGTRHGQVDLDHLSDQARNNYLYARAMVGKELSAPDIERAALLR